MTPIGVKFPGIRNLYVLVVYAPGSRRKVLERHDGRHPWPAYAAGETLRIGGRTVRIDGVARRVERHGDDLRHIVELFLHRRVRHRRRNLVAASNVVPMPRGDDSVVAEFLRYHVLVRVFGGDADAWLAHLRLRGDAGGNLRFVHWVRRRLRDDPSFLATVRRMVEATPFRLSAGAGRL